jgi:hypothetical protein
MITTINEFKQFLNENINYNYNYILTSEDTNKLFQIEEDNDLDGNITEQEYNDFISKVTGMTIKQYIDWRNPDDPEEQYKVALYYLNNKQNMLEFKQTINENNSEEPILLTGQDAKDYLVKMDDAFLPSEVGLPSAVGYYLLQENPEIWIAFESIDGIISDNFDNEEDAKEFATLIFKNKD